MSTPSKYTPLVRIHIKVPEVLANDFEKESRLQYRTKTDALREAMRDYIDKYRSKRIAYAKELAREEREAKKKPKAPPKDDEVYDEYE
jgi:hypothetical protein